MNEVMVTITKGFGKVGAVLQKHSPEILAAVGTAGVVVSAVIACKATTKISKITKEHKETMNIIHDAEITEEYTEKDKQKDTVITYAQTGIKFAKLYAPAAGLMTLSLGCLLGSNNILRRRNAALTAAYTTVYTAFNEYRQRVVDRFGKEVDHQLRYNIKQEEIEEKIVDEKGKEKTVKKKVDVANGEETGYVKYFTKSNPNWDNDDTYVQAFFNRQQQYANDRLVTNANGFISLNTVYKWLGFEETKAGMVVGWIYDPKHPNGDNYIEFDVKKCYIPGENGELEKAYAIDFNVDGEIYSKI